MADSTSGTGRELTSAEAAARLGVKRETLYAYVSRGLLHRRVASDGRTSLFDPTELDEFSNRRSGGVEGEIRTSVSTALTRVGDDGLWLRGEDLVALATNNTDYEAVADLAWGSPADEGWVGIGRTVPGSGGDASPLELDLQALVGDMAEVPLIDRLRIAASLASAADPLRHDRSGRAVRSAGRAVINHMVDSLPERCPPTGDRVADRLWSGLAPRKGSSAKRNVLNMAMVLQVDHGLAPSTLAVRVAASVRCDPYSAVSTGLGVIGGPLHGASSADVHEMLASAEQRGAVAAVGDVLRRAGRLPGVGHAVYRTQDPRYGALMAAIMTAFGTDRRLAVVQEVRDVISQRTDAVANVDLALGSLSYLAGMEADAGEVIFAIARTAGWLAHALEEYDEQPGRFRPRARYTGPTPT